MKKLLAFAAMATIALAGTFALDVEASLGGAYGFEDVFSKNYDLKQKQDIFSNSLGIKAEVTIGLTNKLGIQLDTAFLFPVSISARTTNLEDSKDYTSNGQDFDDGFSFNGFVGPVYKFKVNKKTDIKVGVGFDLATLTYSYDTTITYRKDNSIIPIMADGTLSGTYLHMGIGATFDAIHMINKEFGIKVGLTGAYLWGNKAYVTQKTNDGNYAKQDSIENESNSFYLIPDISVVYKF